MFLAESLASSLHLHFFPLEAKALFSSISKQTSIMADNEKKEYPIKTVVVLVMENRSFDHMLGWMKPLNPEIDGLTGQESNPLNTSDPNSARVKFGDGSVFVDPNPGHSYQDIYEQVLSLLYCCIIVSICHSSVTLFVFYYLQHFCEV